MNHSGSVACPNHAQTIDHGLAACAEPLLLLRGLICMRMKPAGITVGVVILLVELFLLINADILFPLKGDAVRNIMIVYLLMQAVVLSAFVTGLPTLGAKTEMFILSLLGFFVTAVFVSLLPEPVSGSFDIISVTQQALTIFSFTSLLLYAFVKAFIEEVVFRGVLLKYVGNLTQAVLFGGFHLAMLTAMGGSIFVIIGGAIMLSALGYIWGIMTKYGGVLFSTGSHLAWNLSAVGILGVFI